MSEAEAQPQAEKKEEHHHASRKEYWVIFVMLGVLTLLELGVAKMDMGTHLKVSGLVLLALAKATLVALFYMHLKHETRVLRLTVAIPLMVPMLYALVLIGDSMWRHLT
jgi:cytochrome c oxidase subunit 4